MNLKALSFFLLLVTSLHIKIHAQNQATLDSLLKELPEAKADTNQVNLLNQVATQYEKIDPPKGIEYGKKALQSSKKLDWKKGERASYLSLGRLYAAMIDYTTALDYFNKALHIAEQEGNPKVIASSLANLGLLYSNKGELDQAINYYQKARTVRAKAGIPDDLNYFMNIGVLYFQQKKFDQALEYWLQALAIAERDKVPDADIGLLYSNISAVYGKRKDYGNALSHAFKALKIQEGMGNRKGICLAISSVGTTYKHAGLDPAPAMPDSLRNRRACLLKAAYYLEKAEAIATELKSTDMQQKAYWSLAYVNKGLGNYPEAFAYYEKFTEATDSLGNVKKEKEFAKIEAKFQVQKTTDSLKYLAAIKDEEVKQKKLERNGSALLIGLAGIIAVLLVNRQKLKHIQNRKIAETEKKRVEELARLQLEDFTRNIQEKNDLIEQFTTEIEKYQALPCSNELPEKDQTLRTLQSSVILTDEQWVNFQSLFETVHSGYIDRAKERFTGITAAELRFMLLSKIGMNNKEMAAMLGISLEAIRTTKHRLRKKMNLPEIVSLDETIQSI